MESMALVLVDQAGSTKQVFLIFFHTFCLFSYSVFMSFYMKTGRNMENTP